MAFIRRVKTKSGATAIQVAYKAYGKIVKLKHIGSAHTDKEISLLENLAKQYLPEASQVSLFPEIMPQETPVLLRQSCSRLLYDSLSSLYEELGFDSLVDEDFRRLCIAEYQKTEKELVDNQVITAKTEIDGQRIIYQYRAKRASLDLRNIEKQIEKATKIVNGKTTTKKAKFLSVKTKEKGLNQTLIDKARALAGIKGYVTNLDKPDQQIIAYYHQLWRVEQSFRMSKHDLRARPIFHHRREAIEAHLTVVLAALAIGRLIERRTEMSIKRFVRLLRPIRNGVVVVGEKEYEAKPEIPNHIATMLNDGGFGTLI